MTSLFEGGDESVGPADSLRVVTLIDRGVREARSLDGEPGIQADLLETLGGLYEKLGNLPAPTRCSPRRSRAGARCSGPIIRTSARAWSRSACCAQIRRGSRRRSS